jgi:hypothetical protein
MMEGKHKGFLFVLYPEREVCNFVNLIEIYGLQKSAAVY